MGCTHCRENDSMALEPASGAERLMPPIPARWGPRLLSLLRMVGAFLYLAHGTHNNDFDLMSYGKDGQPGGTGENADIGNW